MSSLKIKIDTQSIAAQFKALALEVEQDLNKGVADLAAITHAKVAEMASEELQSSRKTLMDNLGFEEISNGIWVVSIDEDALWIEEGIEANHDMKPDLLRNATKTSKDGYKYRTIPFDYGKPPSQMRGATQMIVAQIKSNLKKQGIPFKKIENDVNGKPKTGKLHSFDWSTKNDVLPGKGNTAQLKGVSIYQTITKTGNVRRDILTFRTVSGSPKSAGKWIHPGFEPKHYLEKAMEWALSTWSDKILPEILNKYK
jgi:hypothetical protein